MDEQTKEKIRAIRETVNLWQCDLRTSWEFTRWGPKIVWLVDALDKVLDVKKEYSE